MIRNHCPVETWEELGQQASKVDDSRVSLQRASHSQDTATITEDFLSPAMVQGKARPYA